MRNSIICLSFVLACLFSALAFADAPAGSSNPDPYFLDFTKAANRDLEDDGIADNGKGGWTDEGVNDFYVYPKVRFGQNSWRGTPFVVIDPAKNDHRSVIMLRGSARCKDLDASVTVPTPSVTGKFIYFLHTSCARPKVLPGNLVATYTLNYADKTSEPILIHNCTEIQQWYVGQWWDNNEARRYPVLMGRNCYSGRWNQYIGLWASQFANPHPEKPIVSVTFESAGADVAAIFAATISNTDFAALRDTPENKIGRPDGPPEGYFDAKLNDERLRIFAAMVDAHLLVGVRSIQTIRPDLIAVTVDSSLGKIAVGLGDAIAKAHATPDNFTITSRDDTDYSGAQHPAKVARQSLLVDSRDIGSFVGNSIFWHTFYLQLPKPLTSGKNYTVTVGGIDKPFASTIDLAFDAGKTPTQAIKVNQVSYFAQSKQRYAYLGWWIPDMGPVDYSAFTKFDVIDEATGKVALSGDITNRNSAATKTKDTLSTAAREADEMSGELVSQMDLAPLPVGKYHIQVPGLGISYSFQVGGEGTRELYFHTMRAFLHQRCGIELTSKITDWPRPACHVEVYENKHLVENHPAHRDNEPIKSFHGGYHDAGDFDCFSSHLPATAQSLTAYELFPQAFHDKDLNLPESGAGIPDVLTEAAWGLGFWADNQQEDGGILFGRGNDCDSLRQVPLKDQLAFGLFKPKNASANAFAATAAQYARLIRPFDLAKADAMLAKAEMAYKWAKAHQPGPKDKDDMETYWQLTWGWAAAELFNTTGNDEYNEDFKMLYNTKVLKGDWKLGQRGVIYNWPYASSTQKNVDPVIQAAMKKEIIQSADWTVKKTQETAYRMGRGAQGGAWGILIGGGFYGDILIRAYAMTHDQKYLDAASLNADFQLGANPLGQSFITGLGTRFPQNPELNPALKDGLGKTVKGISIYGPGGGGMSGYPNKVPIWRNYQDNCTTAENSEFTITETIGPASMLYSSLWAISQGK